jgi:Ribbon-helix-helix protein, copG family
MVFHMKTTLQIDDTVMARLRQEAARQRRTMSDLVESALRLLFHSKKQSREPRLPSLPRFRGGRHLVDVSDRDALYNAMEQK